jgi:uncharacterized sulfatase
VAALGSIATGLETHRPLPNVLFIYTEDTNMDLGAFGHSVVQTPSLDLLAQRGTTFLQAYCPMSICNPSRVSTMTGLFPTTTGVFSNDDVFTAPELNGIPVLPRQFRLFGYQVGGAGKIFHDAFSDPQVWDEYYNESDDQWISKPVNPVPSDGWRPVYWGPFLNGVDGSLGKQRDTKNTDRAVTMIQSYSEPFFVAVGYHASHNPFTYPEMFDSQYDPNVDVPPLPPGESSNWRQGMPGRSYSSASYLDPNFQSFPEGGRLEATAAYWRTISYVDSEIGRLLAALDARGVADNTIVVFLSDHGWSNGHHGRYGKKSLFEQSARVPCLIAAPGLAGAGQSCSAPVNSVDLYPTLMELCGLPKPRGLEGTSLAPLLKQPQQPWDSAAITMVQRTTTETAIAIRNQDYKFCYWPLDGRHVLLHLRSDPNEYQNLYGDARYAVLADCFSDYLFQLELTCGAASRSYGRGLSGTFDVPSLRVTGRPVLGDHILMEISNSLHSSTQAVQFIGFTATQTPFVGGDLLVVPSIWRSFGLPSLGLAAPLSLPIDEGLCGLKVYLQVMQQDPGAVQGWSLTQGLELTLGMH